jgi:hypothetical protein
VILEIRDPFLLGSIRPRNLEGYLRTAGWEMTFRDPGMVSIWTHSGVPDDNEVRLPLDPDASAYPQRIKEILQELAAFEERPEMRVFLDIHDWNCDAVRIGFMSRPNLDYPVLGTEIETLESAREILLAIASSVIEPQPWFGKRQIRKEAADYLATLEVSAFEEPLSIRVLGRLEPVLFGAHEAEFVPFTRQVSLKLWDALHHLESWLNRAEPGEGNDWLTSSLQHGLSANVAESLSKLLQLPPSFGSCVEISLRLAASRRFSGPAFSVWRFQRNHLPGLKEMGDRLKSFVAGPDERVVFLVADIRAGKRGKVITGTALIEDDARRIEMSVDEELIKLAEFAKSRNSAIQCLGRLRRKPDSRRYQVLQPHDFQILHGDDADVEVLRRKMPRSETDSPQMPLIVEQT